MQLADGGAFVALGVVGVRGLLCFGWSGVNCRLCLCGGQREFAGNSFGGGAVGTGFGGSVGDGEGFGACGGWAGDASAIGSAALFDASVVRRAMSGVWDDDVVELVDAGGFDGVCRGEFVRDVARFVCVGGRCAWASLGGFGEVAAFQGELVVGFWCRVDRRCLRDGMAGAIKARVRFCPVEKSPQSSDSPYTNVPGACENAVVAGLDLAG